MKNAYFILYHHAETAPAELTTLAALAATLKPLGHKSVLLVADATGGASVPVGLPGAFDQIIAVKAPQDAGDGAVYMGALFDKLSAGQEVALIVSASTIASRNWAARIAARLKAELLPACDSIAVEGGSLRASTPVMGGLVLKSLNIADRPAVLLYDGADLAADGDAADVPLDDIAVETPGIKLVKQDALPDSGGLRLQGAARVVSGGLGVGSADNWPVIEDFAARVGAAVGASRAAVEMGWVPSSRQVGFSGQKVAPDVYVAVGISGAVHHLAGITGARRIVAINKDPEANIFQIADVAIVGDYKAILEAATRQLEKA